MDGLLQRTCRRCMPGRVARVTVAAMCLCAVRQGRSRPVKGPVAEGMQQGRCTPWRATGGVAPLAQGARRRRMWAIRPPSGALASSSWPPMRETALSTIASPSPEPVAWVRAALPR
ncbi:MAG: hypothetical protein RJA44_438 [Pseudomonadota bacterium]